MVLRYRISLPGIKGFARVYEVKPNSSLYSFAKQMRADMNFPQDQMVLFKAFGSDGAVSARYGMFDMGAGTIDSVTLEQTIKKGELSFVFFYDTTNAKSVNVTFEGEAEPRKGVAYPVLVDSKGPDPEEFENGYVAYEDLPDDKKKDPENDDEDEDWDDDNDADEEGEEIFDEDEDE
ncbi:MAG: hypothetical protein K2O58_03940 [Bacteroidales bacterium]|nr:hypothetical protein [Bacteroidales bacterium]MDE6870617.1 hypothetical protein [Bacteroidales bacterium]MDE7127031.1 hypothetical protein [Bacteroidales bacterium]